MDISGKKMEQNKWRKISVERLYHLRNYDMVGCKQLEMENK